MKFIPQNQLLNDEGFSMPFRSIFYYKVLAIIILLNKAIKIKQIVLINKQSEQQASSTRWIQQIRQASFSSALSAEKISLNPLSNVTRLIIIIMENPYFLNLVALVESKEGFTQKLESMHTKYQINLYKLNELNTKNIIEKYQILQKKFYLCRQTPKVQYWYQNELRLFIWLYFAYLHVFGKLQNELREEDWNYFSSIFNHKSTIFFQFQVRSMIKSQARSRAWSEEETSLLEQIIMYHCFLPSNEKKNHWNSIARDLYVKSHKRFFRNPKQCREKWMNHLDPSKIHTEWKINEDIILLNTIKKKGKRWSVVVKELRNTRTEHMVKNRYKSLILNEKKKYPEKRDSQIQNILIKKLNKMQLKALKTETIIVDQGENLQEQQKKVQRKSIKLEQNSIDDVKQIQMTEVAMKETLINNKMEEQCIKQEQGPMIFQIVESGQEQKVSNSPIYAPFNGDAYYHHRISFESDEQHYHENRVYEPQSYENEDFLRF